MAAIDYTDIQRAIYSHLSSSTSAGMDVGGPQLFDPTNKTHWVRVEVSPVTSTPSREYPRRGQVTLLLMCYTALQGNIYSAANFASQIASAFDRKHLDITDNDNSDTNIGYIKFKEPLYGRTQFDQTWQVVTVTIQGTYQLDQASTLPTLPTT